MKIGIAGLGLIGGSLARALKKYTPHTVFGADANPGVVRAARTAGSIDGELDTAACDVVFACLYPADCVSFLLNSPFKQGAIAADIAGVKECIEQAVFEPLAARGVRYVGTHPMAGKETSGFFNSDTDLFQNASFIITENPKTDEDAIQTLSRLATEIGCARVTRCSAQRHDQVIAYTSQLPHVVSNAFVKNKSAGSFKGFSAGSFNDLTRVAKMNDAMWAQLFALNADALVRETDELIAHLNELRDAIAARDETRLRPLLKAGSDIKERLNGEYK